MRWWRHKTREQDLERELRSDLELEAAELEANGLSAEAARSAAHRAIGNTTLVKEMCDKCGAGLAGTYSFRTFVTRCERSQKSGIRSNGSSDAGPRDWSQYRRCSRWSIRLCLSR
jgi:hypothetical protein